MPVANKASESDITENIPGTGISKSAQQKAKDNAAKPEAISSGFGFS